RIPCLTSAKLPGLTKSATCDAFSGETTSPGLTLAALAVVKRASANEAIMHPNSDLIVNPQSSAQVSSERLLYGDIRQMPPLQQAQFRRSGLWLASAQDIGQIVGRLDAAVQVFH